MKTLIIEWAKRIVGYGLGGAASYVGARYGETLGACVGVAGGALLHAATQRITPRAPRTEDITQRLAQP